MVAPTEESLSLSLPPSVRPLECLIDAAGKSARSGPTCRGRILAIRNVRAPSSPPRVGPAAAQLVGQVQRNGAAAATNYVPAFFALDASCSVCINCDGLFDLSGGPR
ncbi:hypothetical protein KC19_3G020400 [Ceratodon purpureus]|uniref:Uncharacterized protein n=1 Tax=Ceratodon purpureus TaxID=3225 RepID=A0A8T0IEX3_CERPU|nr:hypothetical protein KC19_3G020400 [Ceratodon purpureus]